MSATNSLHYQLCCEGAKYIIQPRAKERDGWQGPYLWSTVELVCSGCELTDVWATNRDISCVIEVKTSHSDFLNDKKKFSRSERAESIGYPMGNYRYYLCPEGIIKENELPEGWGLLYWNGKKITKIVHSDYFETTRKYDFLALCSIFERENGRHKVFNYRKKNIE